MCLFQFWFPQGICLGVGLLGHMMVLFLVFKGISILSSIVARVFPFLHTLSGATTGDPTHDKGHAEKT